MMSSHCYKDIASYVQWMDQQKDDTRRPDGKQERQKKKVQRHSAKKQNQQLYVQLVGQGRHKGPNGRKDEGLKQIF